MNAEMWIALGALVVSVVAALFTGLSTWYSRGQLDAARRQADVAEAALEFQKRVHEQEAQELGRAPSPGVEEPRPAGPARPPAAPAPSPVSPADAPPASDAGADWTGAAHGAATPEPRVSPWTVTHARGDRYHLTNGSDRTVHDVALEVGRGGRGRTTSERWDRVEAGDPTSFRSPRPETTADRALVVSWAWTPGGPRHEWSAELPPRR
ncbi:hypothetical protein [Isoptericola sp. BMS4]|uniref:hypothetical protein n=1 Tax=Isoptericola sp. BMS4 TaxID=2527875 RepID=UPI001423002D|nr:hypothetical protein [Isoptericola sp. BMS4]